VPSLDKEGVESEFELKIFSSSPVEVLPLPEAKNIVLSGKWESPDANKPLGGCHMYDKEFY